MHHTSNSILRRLIQCAYHTLNKTAEDAIQREMRTSNIIIVFNMLQCFSLVYSYMLGLGLAHCDLGLSHGLAGHCHSKASDIGACL